MEGDAGGRQDDYEAPSTTEHAAEEAGAIDAPIEHATAEPLGTPPTPLVRHPTLCVHPSTPISPSRFVFPSEPRQRKTCAWGLWWGKANASQKRVYSL